MSKLQARKTESYKIFDEIAGTYDFLNRFLSFGIDVYWRKKLLKFLPKKLSLDVLDMATGTGDVPLTLIKHPKINKIIGIDLSKGMVDLGKKKVEKLGLSKRIDLQIGDGVKIPFGDNSFDLVTISFGIRNFSDYKESLKNVYRVLKPGGRILIMEFSIPKNIIFRKVYFFYFRHILPTIGNLLSKHKDAYKYLNETVEDFPYGTEFEQHMKDAGFSDTGFKTQTFGIASLYYGDKLE